jgi:hypothetical protein
MYESEITKFIRDLLDQNPDLEMLQKKNRSTWWDKQAPPDGAKDAEPAEEPIKGYYYFPLPKAAKPTRN